MRWFWIVLEVLVAILWTVRGLGVWFADWELSSYNVGVACLLSAFAFAFLAVGEGKS